MRSLPIALMFVAALSVPQRASGHAAEPSSENVYLADDGWVMRANVGIVQSTNPTELICEEAFLGGEGWMLGVFGPTEWVTFGETSIRRTTDGCEFELVMDVARRPSDSRVHPESGGAAFLLNGVGDGTDGLWVSTDRGSSFRQIQTFDLETEQTTGLRYIDGETLIVSGYSRTDSGAGRAWLVDVATGETTSLTVPEMLTYPYVIAAAPSGHVLLLGRRGDQIVFWGPTDDLGRAEIVASTWPTWAELSDDGQTAWISGMQDGRAITRGALDAAGAATWEILAADYRATCVLPDGEDLYMCGLGRFDGYDLFRLGPGAEPAGVLDFRDFEGARSDCPAGSDVATVCPLVWIELAPYFGKAPPTTDMGVSAGDMGGDAGDGPADVGGDAPAPGGCCATAGGTSGGSVWVCLALLGLLRRRRPLTQKLPGC